MVKANISHRLNNIPASPIRKLAPYAEQVKKQGVKIYHLNIGDPDIKTPLKMISVLKKWKMNPIAYGQSQGEPIFLKALESYYQKINHSFVKKENIQVTSGGSEAISLVFFAITDPGDEILVFEPFYTNYQTYAKVNHINLVPVTTYSDNGFHLPDKKEIEKKITKKTKGIIIANPNNPTGTVYSEKEIKILVELVNKNNLFLISDEVYREFIYDRQKHHSILNHMVKNPKNLILIDSLSKRYSLCGARLGCLVTLNQEILSGVLRIAQGRLSVGIIDQMVGKELINVSPKYFQQVNKEYQRIRNVLYYGLKKIPGVFLKKPEGAFYIVVRLPVKNTENFCKWLLTDFRLNNETLMLTPAVGFYATAGLGRNEVRIAYVLKTEDLKKSLEILKEGLKIYNKQSSK